MTIAHYGNLLLDECKKQIEELINDVESARSAYRFARLSFETPSYPAVPAPMSCPIPSKPGIYFVWANGMVVYVGQAIVLSNRLRASHGCIVEGDKLSWIEFGPEELNFAEAYYIGVCRPIRNFGMQKRLVEAGMLYDDIQTGLRTSQSALLMARCPGSAR